VPDDSVVQGLGTQVTELGAALHELRARPTIEPQAVEELRARLEALEGRSDEDVRAALAEVSGRLEAVAQRPADDPSWTAELWLRLEAVERRSDDDLRRRVEELAARQHELAQQAEGGPPGLDELYHRVSQLEDKGEPWRALLDVLEERLESLGARPTVEPELVDELRIRIQGVEGRSDDELHGLVHELSRRLDDLAQRPGVDAALVDQLGSRLTAAEELGSRIDGLDEVWSRLAALEARSDAELWSRLDELHSELSALRSRPAIDPSVVGDLERQIESLEGHESPDARRALEAVASLRDRIEALEGGGDDGLRNLVETLGRRIEGLEQHSAEDASVPARLDELEERQRVEAAGLADRVSDALGALTAWIDALRAAEGEARSVLADATQRVDELERRSARLDEVERSVVELRDRPAENEATVALWRAVDTLRGRSEQSLALLGELGSRVEGLESVPRDQPRSPAEPESVAEPARPLSPDEHVLFVAGGDRYELLERDGAPPDVGEWIALDETAALVVSRVGRSPLPGDERPCAFLTP
jgi:chromosome segregation ATPase